MTVYKKTCSVCGETYPQTTEYFYRHKAGAAGYWFRGDCKKCHNKKRKYHKLERKEPSLRQKREMARARALRRVKDTFPEVYRYLYLEECRALDVLPSDLTAEELEKVKKGKKPEELKIKNKRASYARADKKRSRAGRNRKGTSNV